MKIYGDKARGVHEGQKFTVTKVYTIEGHPVAMLESEDDG